MIIEEMLNGEQGKEKRESSVQSMDPEVYTVLRKKRGPFRGPLPLKAV